jgi:hypothetical protein
MALETTYKGFSCSYGENQDTWNCPELEFWGCATLSALKVKIDLHERKKRKKAELVPAYRLDHEGKIALVHVSTLAEKPRAARQGYGDYDAKPGAAWVIREPDDRSKRQRSKESISDLVRNTPENVAMLHEYKRLREAYRAALKQADDYKKTIPRYTYDELAAHGATEAEEA